MNKYLDDLFYFFGALLVTAGVGTFSIGLALIAAGGFCLIFSYLLGKAMR